MRACRREGYDTTAAGLSFARVPRNAAGMVAFRAAISPDSAKSATAKLRMPI
jgi:hypothetical protein